MSPKTPAAKRRTNRSTVLSKGSQITKDLANMGHIKFRDKAKETMGLIVQYLEDKEEQVDVVWDALQKGFFGEEYRDDYLHPSYVHIAKVPRWVETGCLKQADERFSVAVTKALTKKDMGIVKQLFSITLTGPTFHIPCRKISSYQRWACARSTGMGAGMINKIEWGSQCVVDWQKHSRFVLELPKPEGVSRSRRPWNMHRHHFPPPPIPPQIPGQVMGTCVVWAGPRDSQSFEVDYRRAETRRP